MADEIQWITVRGRHIPLGKGETAQDAIKRVFNSERSKSVAKHNEDVKEQQIKKAQEERDRLNREHDTDNSRFREIDNKKFNKLVAKAKESQSLTKRWRVDVHKPEEYDEKGAKVFVSKGGNSTVAVTADGDIISVCKRTTDHTIRGKDLMEHAVAMGGKKLDSFGGNHRFYVACGFEPVSWTPFSVKYAPPGWAESKCAQEPVVFYKYVGKGNVKNTRLKDFLANTKPFTGDDGYDDAYAYRDKQIKSRKENK